MGQYLSRASGHENGPAPPAAGDVTLGQAADAYLATLHSAGRASTRRTYGRILRWLVTEFGADAAPDIDPDRFAAWFTAQWAGRSPSTWNVSLAVIRSAAAWWRQQDWITADPSRMLKRRKPRPDRPRALSRPEVEQLLTRPIEAVTGAARKIASGAFDLKVPETSSGEAGELIRAFNRMTSELQNRTERLLAAERVAAWQEVARRLAHEIKNPLTPIKMSLETLVAAGARGEPRFKELFGETAPAVLE